VAKHKPRPRPIDRAAVMRTAIDHCGGDVILGLLVGSAVLAVPPLGRPWHDVARDCAARQQIRALEDELREGGADE
jgi:hypothetical protein